MTLAQDIVQTSWAAIFISAGLSLGLFILSMPLFGIETLIRESLLKRKLRNIPIAGPVTLKVGRKPNIIDFLVVRVHMREPQAKSLQLDDNVFGFEERKNVIGLACPICRGDLGGGDEQSLMVVPQCFHICHTKCFNRKFSQKNTCPSCDREVEAKAMKEVQITSKPYIV